MQVAVAHNNSHDHTDDFIIDIDDDIHDSIDRVIDFYITENIEPRFTFSGSPLDIAADLARNVKASLPDTYQEDAVITLNYMISQFVDYCHEVKSNNMTVTFAFKSGQKEQE